MMNKGLFVILGLVLVSSLVMSWSVSTTFTQKQIDDMDLKTINFDRKVISKEVTSTDIIGNYEFNIIYKDAKGNFVVTPVKQKFNYFKTDYYKCREIADSKECLAAVKSGIQSRADGFVVAQRNRVEAMKSKALWDSELDGLVLE